MHGVLVLVAVAVAVLVAVAVHEVPVVALGLLLLPALDNYCTRLTLAFESRNLHKTSFFHLLYKIFLNNKPIIHHKNIMSNILQF